MTAEKYGDGRDIIGQTIARYLIAGYFMTVPLPASPRPRAPV